MSSRRKHRVGGGKTSARSSSLSSRTEPPTTSDRQHLAARKQPSRSPPARAQTADVLRLSGRVWADQGVRRATTALAEKRLESRRSGAATVRGPREAFSHRGVDIPPLYEADERDSFYTAAGACRLGRIFSDSRLIQPAWGRVSTSPWGQAAQKCGGYGKRLLNGSNSVDAPDFMLSKRFEGYRNNFTWKKRPRAFAYGGEANTAVSNDVPTFFRGRHTQVYGQAIEPVDKPRLIKLLLEGRVIGEPSVPETDWSSQPLDWDERPAVVHPMAQTT